MLTEQIGKLLEWMGLFGKLAVNRWAEDSGMNIKDVWESEHPAFFPLLVELDARGLCSVSPGMSILCWRQKWQLEGDLVGQVSLRAWIWTVRPLSAVRISSEAAFHWKTESLFTLQDFCLSVLKASGPHLWLVDLCLVTDSLPSLAVPQKLCWGTVPPEQAWTS